MIKVSIEIYDANDKPIKKIQCYDYDLDIDCRWPDILELSLDSLKGLGYLIDTNKIINTMENNYFDSGWGGSNDEQM